MCLKIDSYSHSHWWISPNKAEYVRLAMLKFTQHMNFLNKRCKIIFLSANLSFITAESAILRFIQVWPWKIKRTSLLMSPTFTHNRNGDSSFVSNERFSRKQCHPPQTWVLFKADFQILMHPTVYFSVTPHFWSEEWGSGASLLNGDFVDGVRWRRRGAMLQWAPAAWWAPQKCDEELSFMEPLLPAKCFQMREREMARVLKDQVSFLPGGWTFNGMEGKS